MGTWLTIVSMALEKSEVFKHDKNVSWRAQIWRYYVSNTEKAHV